MLKIFDLKLPTIKNQMELDVLIATHPNIDPGYIGAASILHQWPKRDLIERMWTEFHPYADPGFHQKIKTEGKFLSHAWEMTLGTAFLRLGYKLETRRSDLGPDIKLTSTSPNIWIEAVSCTPGNGPDAVPPLIYGVVQTVAMNEIVLRIGNAMTNKFLQYQTHLNSGLIKDSEPFVVAISKGSIGQPDAYPPATLRYLYGIGDIALRIPLDPHTGERKVTETFFTRQKPLPKKQGKEVPVAFFENLTNTGISAVIYSDNHILNHPEPLGSDFVLLRNPNAKNPLPEDFLSIGSEWIAKNGRITYFEKSFIKQADAFAYLENKNPKIN